MIRAVYADPGFEVLSNSLFKKNRFPLETDRLHPFKRIPNSVVTVAPETEKESIGTKFDVIAHHARVHPDQFDGESDDNEFHFNLDRVAYNFSDARGWELVDKLQVEEARKIAVHPLIAAYQLIAEA